MPNLQVLERVPIRRAIPGFIERQEFKYIRHDTVISTAVPEPTAVGLLALTAIGLLGRQQRITQR